MDYGAKVSHHVIEEDSSHEIEGSGAQALRWTLTGSPPV
jgi:hypothetical protein